MENGKNMVELFGMDSVAFESLEELGFKSRHNENMALEEARRATGKHDYINAEEVGLIPVNADDSSKTGADGIDVKSVTVVSDMDDAHRGVVLKLNDELNSLVKMANSGELEDGEVLSNKANLLRTVMVMGGLDGQVVKQSFADRGIELPLTYNEKKEILDYQLNVSNVNVENSFRNLRGQAPLGMDGRLLSERDE